MKFITEYIDSKRHYIRILRGANALAHATVIRTEKGGMFSTVNDTKMLRSLT